MTKISGQLASFAKAEKAFADAHKLLAAELDELDRNLRLHLDQWTGDAADAYWKAHAEWKAAADDMPKRIAWLHSVLSTTHGNFGNALTRTHAMWAAE